jgi:hypothetical protein
MRSIKQRRTKTRTDSNGNIKRSTFNGTSKTKRYINKNTHWDVTHAPSVKIYSDIFLLPVSSSSTGHSMLYSYNGINWEGLGIIFNTQNERLNSVKWNGEIWVAVGKSNTTAIIGYSMDGLNWTQVAGNPFGNNNQFAVDLEWNGEKWLAIADSQGGKIIESYDGKNWTNLSSSEIANNFSSFGIAYGDNKWILFGQTSPPTINNIYYSTDNGITWNLTTSPFQSYANRGYYNGETWIAVGVGSSNNIALSTDGINWTGKSSNIGFGADILYGNNIWVAVGNTGGAYSTNNGDTWTSTTGTSIDILEGVTWNKNLNLWVVSNGSSASLSDFFYSNDGINWLNIAKNPSLLPTGFGAKLSTGISYVYKRKTITHNCNEGKNASMCKGTPYRNPILGYRKQLDCSANCKDASGDIYIDNYAKSCMTNPNVCYNQRIKRIQNKNGCIDESYNYSTNQYLTRRCSTAEQQEYFLSSNSVKDQKNMFKKCNNCSFDENGVCTSCKISKAKCVTIYKRSNRKFNRQGGVSGGSRINRLKYQSRMKAQTRRINNKNNIINAKYPASLYAAGKPLALRDNTCKNPRPVIITSVVPGDYSFTIYWKNGDIPCAAKVDGYTLERTGSPYGHKIRLNANQNSYTYNFPNDPKLLGVTYDIRIRTENFYGPGVWTYYYKNSFNTGPSAPKDLDLSWNSTGDIKLKWSKPEKNGGSEITSWKIRYFHGKKFIIKGNNYDDEIVIENDARLKDGINFKYNINDGNIDDNIHIESGLVTFEIAGINSAGLGCFGLTQVKNINFVPNSPHLKKLPIDGIGCASSDYNLYWIPSDVVGMSDISGYILKWNESTSEDISSANITSATTDISFVDILYNGTKPFDDISTKKGETYDFTLITQNLQGFKSPPSNKISVTFPKDPINNVVFNGWTQNIERQDGQASDGNFYQKQYVDISNNWDFNFGNKVGERDVDFSKINVDISMNGNSQETIIDKSDKIFDKRVIIGIPIQISLTFVNKCEYTSDTKLSNVYIPYAKPFNVYNWYGPGSDPRFFRANHDKNSNKIKLEWEYNEHFFSAADTRNIPSSNYINSGGYPVSHYEISGNNISPNAKYIDTSTEVAKTFEISNYSLGIQKYQIRVVNSNPNTANDINKSEWSQIVEVHIGEPAPWITTFKRKNLAFISSVSVYNGIDCIVKSSNGINWEDIGVDKNFFTDLNDIKYYNGKWVAVGKGTEYGNENNYFIASSNNGFTWTKGTFKDGNNDYKDEHAEGLSLEYDRSENWIVVGKNKSKNLIFHSTDGHEWSKIIIEPSDPMNSSSQNVNNTNGLTFDIAGVTFGNNLWIFYGEGQKNIGGDSNDNQNNVFTYENNGDFKTPNDWASKSVAGLDDFNSINRIVFNGYIFLACGEPRQSGGDVVKWTKKELFVSENNFHVQSWIEVEETNSLDMTQGNDIFYNNNIWIIVGQGSNNQNDNIAWINNPSDLNKGFMSSWNKSNGAALPGVKGVSWSEKHKLWVASPFMPSNFLYSTDGKSWNTGTKATNFSSNAWGAGFIAPASSSQIEFVWDKLDYTGHDISYNLQYSHSSTFDPIVDTFNVNAFLTNDEPPLLLPSNNSNVIDFKEKQTFFRLKYGNELNFNIHSNIAGPAYWDANEKIGVTISLNKYILSWPYAHKTGGTLTWSPYNVNYHIIYNNHQKTMDANSIEIDPSLLKNKVKTSVSVEALSPFTIGNGTDPLLNIDLVYPFSPDKPVSNQAVVLDNRKTIKIKWGNPTWKGLYELKDNIFPDVEFKYVIELTKNNVVKKTEEVSYYSGKVNYEKEITLDITQHNNWGRYYVNITSVVTYEGVEYTSHSLTYGMHPKLYLGFKSADIDAIFKPSVTNLKILTTDFSYYNDIGDFRYYLYYKTPRETIGGSNDDGEFFLGNSSYNVIFDEVEILLIGPGGHGGKGAVTTALGSSQKLGGGGGGAGGYYIQKYTNWEAGSQAQKLTLHIPRNPYSDSSWDVDVAIANNPNDINLLSKAGGGVMGDSAQAEAREGYNPVGGTLINSSNPKFGSTGGGSGLVLGGPIIRLLQAGAGGGGINGDGTEAMRDVNGDGGKGVTGSEGAIEDAGRLNEFVNAIRHMSMSFDGTNYSNNDFQGIGKGGDGGGRNPHDSKYQYFGQGGGGGWGGDGQWGAPGAIVIRIPKHYYS